MPHPMDPRDHFTALSSFEGPAPPADVIGHSREGRPLHAHRIGTGSLSINLVGGCHADEPVGPRLLENLAGYLSSDAGEPLRSLGQWSILPHINPDGAAVNAPWQPEDAEEYDFGQLLQHRVRELPGDDIEFGFGTGASALRPENTAALDFWRSGGPVDLHVSMHGMSVSAGPYFLVEEGWWPRFVRHAERLARDVAGAGYTLHDAERQGEKGFHRLARGFCTRPDSRAMRDHFLALGDEETAGRFRPSSMEAVRSFSDDPLTLVTEMPLFITPGVGVTLGPPDPRLEDWQQRIAGWLARVKQSEGDSEVLSAVGAEAEAEGLRPMPVRDQMRLQWSFICSGIAAASGGGQRSA